MDREAYEKGQIRQACQDGNREFISLLACICADGTWIPPSLIYKGKSQDLQSSWVENLRNDGVVRAHFGVSPNGWSSNAFGLYWLEHVFDRYTRRKANNRRRLLIVDGHSSHVNMEFIKKADKLRIILLILPPHATHRLQPLDIGLFQPLATYYSNEVQKVTYESLGRVSMTKRHFYPLFCKAWLQSFTENNINSSFEKAGIWPYNPSKVMDKLTGRPQTPQDDFLEPLKTPLTSKGIRQLHLSYKVEPTALKLKKIFHTHISLAAQVEIHKVTIKGLENSIELEKTKRKRGKKLGLDNCDESGPVLHSPGRVQEKLALLERIEEEAEQEQARKVAEKIEKAAKKLRDKEEKAEKAL